MFDTNKKTGISPSSGVPLIDTDIVVNEGIIIYNFGETIYIGPSGKAVSAMFPIASGDSIFLRLRHPNEVYVQSITNSGQSLFWLVQ